MVSNQRSPSRPVVILEIFDREAELLPMRSMYNDPVGHGYLQVTIHDSLSWAREIYRLPTGITIFSAAFLIEEGIRIRWLAEVCG